MEKLEAELYGNALDKYEGDKDHAHYDARMELEAELYGNALDKYEGDKDHAHYDARMELERMADDGCEEAQTELSHKAW